MQKAVKRQIAVALGVLAREDGRILMSKRFDPKNRGMHGRWEFPGGKLEFGETPRKAVEREVLEEVGIHATAHKLVDVFSWFHPDRPHIQIILIVYIMKTDAPDAARPSCNEVSRVCWVTIEHALRLNVAPNNRIILRAVLRTLENIV